MILEMVNSRNGEQAEYKTTLEVIDLGDTFKFVFYCEHTGFYCPFKNYNDPIYKGDICELHIGTDPKREEYFEISVNQENAMFISKHKYCGLDENGHPILQVNLQPKFAESTIDIDGNNYTATLLVKKADIMNGDGEIYFNAYRIECDGDTQGKHGMAVFCPYGKFNTPSKFQFIKDYV